VEVYCVPYDSSSNQSLPGKQLDLEFADILFGLDPASKAALFRVHTALRVTVFSAPTDAPTAAKIFRVENFIFFSPTRLPKKNFNLRCSDSHAPNPQLPSDTESPQAKWPTRFMTVPLASTLERPTAVLPSSKALTWKSVRAKPSHRAIEPLRGLSNTHLPTVANEQGSFTTPSFVSFTSEERLIGEAAKNQAAMNPVNTIFDVK
jgi:hypothetical protein